MDKVVHFEIPYDSKERASRFYGEIIGCYARVADCEGNVIGLADSSQ